MWQNFQRIMYKSYWFSFLEFPKCLLHQGSRKFRWTPDSRSADMAIVRNIQCSRASKRSAMCKAYVTRFDWVTGVVVYALYGGDKSNDSYKIQTISICKKAIIFKGLCYCWETKWFIYLISFLRRTQHPQINWLIHFHRAVGGRSGGRAGVALLEF